MTKRELAEKFFLEGYNCAQSVALAFAFEIGIDEVALKKISSSFGGGLGRLREVCGAVSGMAIVLGAIYGYDNPQEVESKKNLYSIVQLLALKFKEKNGSYICKDLLGLTNQSLSSVPEKRTATYYKKRPCVSLVGDAAEILEEFLNNNL